SHTTTQQAEFDRYAEHYHAELDHVCRRLVDPQDSYFVDLKCDELLRIVAGYGLQLANLTLADIGCGAGDFEPRLAPLCARLYGVDLSGKMLQVAQQRAPLRQGGYLCADSLCLPLPDESVDVVFASCLLHHITHVTPAQVVHELQRICRPGGLVVCFEHNPLNPVTQLVVRTTPIDQTAVLLHHGKLQQAFVQSGLGAVDYRFVLFGPKAIDRRVAQRLGWLHEWPVGAQYVVYGQKGG
ncbi:MAG TPA: methyltransferase domain-containing protein, partial [Caldilineaceae bacterium]|nr:methyltransferase domain-containing protein [Caldilineaceae bacterium]